jgi:zinc transport system ATP-binding protein
MIPAEQPDQSWAIELENVGVTAGGLRILDGVTGRIEPGCITAIIGPNGAGKTTLLLAILGQIEYEGAIRFIPPGGGNGSDAARPVIGYVPQRLDFDRGLPIHVRDFLAGSVQRRPLWLRRDGGVGERVRAVLDRVGMRDFEDRRLGALSGGEIQRVLLAQALLQEPKVLLLDEPSSAVDVAGESLFCDVLQSVHQRRLLTTIWVSHDLSVVSSHADHVLCLNKSIACAGTPEAMLTTERIQELFGPHSTVYSHHDHAHHEHEPH